MQVVASQPSSVIEVSLEPGDELASSLKRALADGGFKDAFIVGSGEIEDAEVLTLSANGGKRQHRKIAGAADLVSLSGTVGEAGLELRASLAYETEAGPMTAGGILMRATVVSVVARALVRAGTEAQVAAAAFTPVAVVHAAPIPLPPAHQPVAPIPLPPPAQQPAAPSPPAAPPPPAVGSSPGHRDPEPPRQAPAAGPPVPIKSRRTETIEVYPEENDVVTHFMFGKCLVVFSDGERLRLQQERDGRVREVALSMLKIEDPIQLENGRRQWELTRKN